MKRKVWFTLVEILIVIVILGILSTAILPKLTGYLAKTKDIKRQMDLRNIAAAIESYKWSKGELPKRKNNHVQDREFWFGSVDRIDMSEELLNNIPHDPQKAMIKVHNFPYTDPKNGSWHRTHFRWGKDRSWGGSLKPGEYLYQLMKKADGSCNAAVLVAKTETTDHSNFVLDMSMPYKYEKWGTRTVWQYVRNNWITKYLCPDMNINKLHLCSSIIKSKSWTIKSATKDNSDCEYTNPEQLYYILKIE